MSERGVCKWCTAMCDTEFCSRLCEVEQYASELRCQLKTANDTVERLRLELEMAKES